MAGVTNPNYQQDLAEEALKRLEAKFNFVKGANRDYSRFLNNDGTVDKGTTFDIPAQNWSLTASDSGYAALAKTTSEKKMQMTLDKETNAGWTPDVNELQFFAKKNQLQRFRIPRLERMASDIELDIAWRLFRATYRFRGQAGVQPSTYQTVANLSADMNDQDIPMDERWLYLSNSTSANISFAGFLSNDLKISRAFTQRAVVPANTMDFAQIMRSNVVMKHQAGVGLNTATPANGLVACGTVKTSVANGATTITLTGLGTSVLDVLREGDKLIIPSISTVDLVHKQVQGQAVTFSVLSGTDPTPLPTPVDPQDTRYQFASDSSGDLTVTYCESDAVEDGCLYFSGAEQNIASQITAGTPVLLVTANTAVGSTVKATYEANISFYTQAVQFAAPASVTLDKRDTVAVDPYIATGVTWYQDKQISTGTPSAENRWRMQWARRIFPVYSMILLG
jgi:hypothetical protein